MQQIEKELLHFFKSGPGSFRNVISYITKESTDWCPYKNHGGKEAYNCYLQHTAIVDLSELLKRYSITLEYLEQSPYFADEFNKELNHFLDPKNNFPHSRFIDNINRLQTLIRQREKKIFDKIKGLTCMECQRLDEAISCRMCNSFLAATVMAVSATEARLHYLVEKKDKKIYNSIFKEATLGSLIKLFDKNEYKDPKYKKLKQILPEKHRPLLDLLNTYRIFSAHPKVGSLDYKISNSIINLVFSFLLDPELKITNKSLLSHT